MLPEISIYNTTIYTYPLFIGFSWGISYSIASNLNKTLTSKQVQVLFGILFLASWVGAKLLYIFTAQEFVSSGTLSFWVGGGFVFYGGAILASISTFIFIKLTSQKKNDFGFLVPAIAIGHCVGRLGCFFAGCCHGTLFIPIQIVESLCLLAGGIYFYIKYKSGTENLLLKYALYYSSVRFCLEYFRDDHIRGIWMLNLSTSQLISIGVFVSSSLIYISRRLNRNMINELIK
jgi:phosphatidylglycerol:prolipoprotein diacylglycerol transferase